MGWSNWTLNQSRSATIWCRPRALNLPPVKPGELGAGRGEQIFFVWIDDPQSPLELKITGGLIAHYRDRGNVRIDLWKVGGPSETGERETKVAHDASVPPDGEEHTVRLDARERVACTNSPFPTATT